MLRRIIWLDTESGSELVMPVTPSSYQTEKAREAESLDMAYFSRVNLPGLKSPYELSETYLLPAQDYPFAATASDPQTYLDWLTKRCNAGTVCRYIVSGTNVNDAVLITDVRHEERDGTNDVYVTVTRREYVELQTEVTVDTQNMSRASGTQESAGAEQSYTVQSGDCLWDICRTYYGDGSLCYQLAAYNSIANANLIYAGQNLKLPDASVLSGISGSGSSAAASSGAAASQAKEEAKATIAKERQRLNDQWQVVAMTE